jgi:hypothetical protein
MSSSNSGQWIPTPPPTRRQLARSACVPCERRGNQASGTVMVLPSARSTISASSLAVTPLAITSLISVSEILMPSPHQNRSVFANQSLNPPNLHTAKAPAPLKTQRIKPELDLGFLPLHVNMGRFVSIRRVEEEPVWPGSNNCRQRFQCTWSSGSQTAARVLLFLGRGDGAGCVGF